MTLANVVLVAMIASMFGQPEPPTEGGGGIAGQFAGSEAVLEGERQQRAFAEDNQSVSRALSSSSTMPTRITTLVVACTGNGPEPDFTNVVFCDASRLGCEATPETTDILYWRWLGTRRADGTVDYDLSPSGEVCDGPDEAGEQVDVPELTLADFQRLPLPAGTPTIQPGGYTLINVPTNVYVEAEPVTLDTTLLGFPVEVRATPSRYRWDFGDGAGLGPTTDPGAPYPALTTTHTYESTGRYAVVLTTHYTGEYSVAGGPWLPVDGEAEVASAPVDVQALAGRNVLVDAPLDG